MGRFWRSARIFEGNNLNFLKKSIFGQPGALPGAKTYNAKTLIFPIFKSSKVHLMSKNGLRVLKNRFFFFLKNSDHVLSKSVPIVKIDPGAYFPAQVEVEADFTSLGVWP